MGAGPALMRGSNSTAVCSGRSTGSVGRKTPFSNTAWMVLDIEVLPGFEPEVVKPRWSDEDPRSSRPAPVQPVQQHRPDLVDQRAGVEVVEQLGAELLAEVVELAVE